jgi:hypothetical protein
MVTKFWEFRLYINIHNNGRKETYMPKTFLIENNDNRLFAYTIS